MLQGESRDGLLGIMAEIFFFLPFCERSVFMVMGANASSVIEP